MSLFHSGKELFDRFGLSVESEIIFADYCSALIFVYRDNIRFTSKALLFVSPKEAYRDIQDEWIAVDSLDFVPWQSVLSFENMKGSKITEHFDEVAIRDWLSGVNDPLLDFP